MSHSTKKDKTIIRYLVTGTQEKLKEEEIQDKASFSLEVSLAPLIERGYELLESDLPQGDFEQTLKSRIYTVYLRERVTIVFPSQPRQAGEPVDGLAGLFWPIGLDSQDLEKTFSRQVRYQFEDGTEAAPSVSETLEFDRSAMFNHVTGAVSYMPWQATGEGDFSEISSPDLPGYTVDKALVPAIEGVNPDADVEQDIIVTYTKQKQFAKLVIRDAASGDELFADDLEGETKDPIDYPVSDLLAQYQAKGYEVVDNPFSETCFFGEETDSVQEFVVTIQPRVALVHAGELPEVGQPVYPELANSVVWPRGVRESKLKRTVVRTIVNQHEDGTIINTIEQTVEFRRPAQINLLTQEISYAAWELVSDVAVFPAYTPEVLDGYAPRPRKLPEITNVTADSANLRDIITYTRKIQRVTVQFVDQTQGDLLLHKTQLVGKTGEPIRYDDQKKIQEFVNNGYDVVDNGFPKEALFGTEEDGQVVYTIVLAPKTLRVTASAPKAAGTYIDDQSQTGPKWPVGVDEQALRHLVTRTVHYRYENEKPARNPHVDGILFERDAQINLVTGQVSYTDWTSTETAFEDHVVPVVEGYYATRERIAGQSGITVESADFEVVVYYIKTSNQVHYTIIDTTTDETLDSQLINGRSAQKLKEEINRHLEPYLARGYQLDNGQRLDLALKNPDKNSLVIELSQVTRPISLGQLPQAHGLVDGYDQLTWPVGVEPAQLQKTVSRFVHLAYATGEEISSDLSQTVTFTRTAEVNLVTGAVAYGDWTSESTVFPAMVLPELDGCRPSLTELPELPVTADDLDQVVQVVYYGQSGQVTVTYYDAETDTVLATDQLSGQIGKSFTYDIANRLVLLGLAPYDLVETSCPAEIAFIASEQVYRVVLRARTVTVTADQPHVVGTTTLVENYGLFTWPEGLTKEDLSAQLQRRIRYQDETGTDLFDEIIEQTAQLSRTATVNLATKAVSYSPWVADKEQLEAVNSPHLVGFLPEMDQVPVLDLTVVASNLVNKVVDTLVLYHKQAYQAQLQVVDGLRGDVLSDIALSVLSKEDILPSYEQLTARYQKQGYLLSQDGLDLSDWALGDVKTFTVTVQPQLMTVSLDHIAERFASFDEEIAAQLQALEGLSRLDLSREVTRRVKYVYTNGKIVAREHKESILFKRTARVNLVTSEIFYDDWNSYYPIFDEVLSPVVDGYTPSKEIVEAIEQVTAEAQDSIETIVYTRNIQQVVVNVIDKTTGNIIYAESITGTNNEEETGYKVSQFVKKGYDFVSQDQVATSSVEPTVVPELISAEPEVPETVETPTEEKETKPVQKGLSAIFGGRKVEKKPVEIAKEPVVETVQQPLVDEQVVDQPIAENPVVEQPTVEDSIVAEPVVNEPTPILEPKLLGITFGDTELQEQYGIAPDQLKRCLTRTVQFLDESGQVLQEPLVQTVAFTRAATLNTVTKELTYSDWLPSGPDTFEALEAPKLEGYEPSIEHLEAYSPAVTEESVVTRLTYRKASAIENISIIFLDKESGQELMNFNFLDKGPAYCEKKVNKGISFLKYKGYELVDSEYPNRGEIVFDDTMRYQIFLSFVDEEKESVEEEEIVPTVNRPVPVKAEAEYQDNDDDNDDYDYDYDDDDDVLVDPKPSRFKTEKGKQKKILDFLFKD